MDAKQIIARRSLASAADFNTVVAAIRQQRAEGKAGLRESKQMTGLLLCIGGDKYLGADKEAHMGKLVGMSKQEV